MTCYERQSGKTSSDFFLSKHVASRDGTLTMMRVCFGINSAYNVTWACDLIKLGADVNRAEKGTHATVLITASFRKMMRQVLLLSSRIFASAYKTVSMLLNDRHVCLNARTLSWLNASMNLSLHSSICTILDSCLHLCVHNRY